MFGPGQEPVAGLTLRNCASGPSVLVRRRLVGEVQGAPRSRTTDPGTIVPSAASTPIEHATTLRPCGVTIEETVTVRAFSVGAEGAHNTARIANLPSDRKRGDGD